MKEDVFSEKPGLAAIKMLLFYDDFRLQWPYFHAFTQRIIQAPDELKHPFIENSSAFILICPLTLLILPVKIPEVLPLSAHSMMKKKLLLLISFAFLLVLKGYSQSMILLEGTYQGKNVYVQNPFASSGVGFCVYEVRVNDQVTTDEIGSSAFEIDLRNFNLKVGDPLTIKIFHKDDCKPKVLNPEVLKPKSTFVTSSITINCGDEMLKWTTTGEQGKLTYIVEQYRWNKWVKVGEVDGLGTPGPNNYTFKVVTHSGENQFRVKQVDYSGQARTSPVAKCTSTKPAIKFYPVKAKTTISFVSGDPEKPTETLWEIYDQYGNIVKKGFGSSIDVTGLAKGGYFLNYDNSVGEFFKQ